MQTTLTNCVDANKTASDEVDLLFIIAKYLKGSKCKNTAEALINELEEKQLLPSKYSWMGERINLSFHQLEKIYSHISSDHLLNMCKRLQSLIYASTTREPFLLGSGSYSMVNSSTSQEIHLKKFKNSIDTCKVLKPPFRDYCLNRTLFLRNRELSGFGTPRSLMPVDAFRSVKMLRRYLGHFSAIYCVTYDRTGQYVFTGSDDCLIKLWSVNLGGRLLCTFRGHDKEISDIDVSYDNNLLASGSCDRTVRIWGLVQGKCRYVLRGHNGMITNLQFSPYCRTNDRWLASTGSDGVVCCWQFLANTNEFNLRPIKFNERTRPGSQMSCLSFSSGGSFMAVGSSDYIIRVYYFQDSGPIKICELEEHTYRVDGISYAPGELRFASSSRDGTARIWSYDKQSWRSIVLNSKLSTTKTKSDKSMRRSRRAFTLAAWSCDCLRLVTAQCGNIIKVWDTKSGVMLMELKGHSDADVNVLECHPFLPNLALSAGYDGNVILWDIDSGRLLKCLNNTILGRGDCSFIDARWSPIGDSFVASDLYGHLMFFSVSDYENFKLCPDEQFFHTDTQYMSSDPDDTQMLEEDPPFYVDGDGHPYPAALQRLVLGRENLPESDLRPQHVEISEDGRTQVLPQPSIESSIIRIYNVDPRELFRPYLISRLVKPIDAATLRHSELLRSQAYTEEVVHFLNESKMKTMQCHLKTTPDCCNSSSGKRVDVDNVAQMLASQALGSSTSGDESSEHEGDMGATISACEDVDEHVEESLSTDGDADNNLSLESSDWAESTSKRVRTYRKRKRKSKVDIPSKRRTSAALLTSLGNDSKYQIPRWITTCNTLPFVPQIGDEVAYIRQCHRIYCDVVKNNRIYDMDTVPVAGPPVAFYKITHVRTHILPPRVLSLKLVPMDENGRLKYGDYINVRYHEIPNISSFLVLKQIYDKAMARNWMPGDRFRSIRDECWITGVIISMQPFSKELTSCPFQCYKVKWDNGLKGRLSPWDLYPPVRRYSRYRCQPVPITSDEMRSIMYVDGEDWGPMQTRDEQIERIVDGMNHLMETSLAEPFNAPVDLVLFPTYAAIIDYPLDLRTIRDRMKNGWYRRPSTVLSDARKISQNAKKFNRRNSGIVKKAVVLTKLLIQFIKDTSCYNIMRMYKEAVKSIFDENCTTESNEDAETSPVTQSEESNTVILSKQPARQKRSKRYDDPSQWHEDCRKLLKDIMRHPDSEPFRHPVDLTEFPNYSAVIDEPIDLSTIRLRLICGSYKNPEEFAKDCRLMFKNSIAYNTNKRSKIYQMTIRLRELFEIRIPDVLSMYSGAVRHIYLSSCKSRCLSSSGDDENDEDFVVGDDDKSSSESRKRKYRRDKRQNHQAKVKRRNETAQKGGEDMSRVQTKTYCTRSGGRRTVHYNFEEPVHVSESLADNDDSVLQFPCRDKKKPKPRVKSSLLKLRQRKVRCKKYRTVAARRRRIKRRVVRTLKADESIYSFY